MTNFSFGNTLADIPRKCSYVYGGCKWQQWRHHLAWEKATMASLGTIVTIAIGRIVT